MRVVDTHAHVWTRDGEFPWAVGVNAPPLPCAEPETLLGLMDANDVDRLVLVQYTVYGWDNSFIAHAVRSYPHRFSAVAKVNPEDPAAPDQLAYWTETYGIRGVRLIPQGDARGDWIRGPLMEPLFRRAADLGVPVLLLTQPSRLSDLARILEGNADVDVVVDHFADCIDGNDEHLEWLLALARFPRVYLKLSHIWVNSQQSYPWTDAVQRARTVCDTFGAQRIMWGSDWPMCLKHASYGDALSYLRGEAKVFTPAELEWILGKTALRLWPAP